MYSRLQVLHNFFFQIFTFFIYLLNRSFHRARRPPSLQQVKPEAGVTVVFDVLLASNLKMSEESFFIHAHGPDFGDFQQNCVDMRAVE